MVISHYNFGIDGNLIWPMHIILGFFFLYVGYITLNHQKVSQLMALTLIVLGILAILYHGHILYLYLLQD